MIDNLQTKVENHQQENSTVENHHNALLMNVQLICFGWTKAANVVGILILQIKAKDCQSMSCASSPRFLSTYMPKGT